MPNKNQENKQRNTQTWYLGTSLSNCWKRSQHGNLESNQRQMPGCVQTGVRWFELQGSSDAREARKQCNIPLTCKWRKPFAQFTIPWPWYPRSTTREGAGLPPHTKLPELLTLVLKLSLLVPPLPSQQNVAGALTSLLSYSNSCSVPLPQADL